MLREYAKLYVNDDTNIWLYHKVKASGQRKLQHEEPGATVYCSVNHNKLVKSKRVTLVRYVTCTGEIGNNNRNRKKRGDRRHTKPNCK
jgi:hypothetical protein